MYSIVQAVNGTMAHCQSTSEATAPGALAGLVVLMTTDLDTAGPLPVVRVPPIGEKGEDEPTTTEMRAAHDLSPLATTTRRIFHDAIAKRVVKKRYGSGANNHSHRFDMTVALSPRSRLLQYLKVLHEAEIGKTGGFKMSAANLQDVVFNKLSHLAAKAVESQRARYRDGGEGKGADGRKEKRRKVNRSPEVEGVHNTKTAAMAAAGFYDESSGDDDENADEPRGISPLVEGRAAVDAWKTAKVCSARFVLNVPVCAVAAT